MTPDFTSLFIKMVAGLILVLALAVVLVRFILPKSRIGGWGRRRIPWAKIIDRFMLEPRKSLTLVKVAGRFFLLGSSERSLNLVGELDRAEGEKIENQVE